MSYALVTLHEAVDLIGVAALVAGGSILWGRLRRRDAQRRIERQERQAAYKLAATRRQKEWDEAQRYFGIGGRG